MRSTNLSKQLRATGDWRDVGRPSSYNASQLPPFLVIIIVIIIIVIIVIMLSKLYLPGIYFNDAVAKTLQGHFAQSD